MTFEIEVRPYEDPDVVLMVDEVQQEYVVRYGGPDAAVVDLREFAPPGGLFLVGVLDGEAVATGGWRRVEGQDSTAEIKRMYVRASARRRGLARLMLAEVERTAAAAGVRLLVLNTGPQQPEAIALYTAQAYLPATPFGHYADYPGAVFLGKSLT